MEKKCVVKMKKDFDKHQLLKSIDSYMHLELDGIEQLETTRPEENTFKFSVMYKNTKRAEWKEGRSVCLSFDNDICTVKINYETSLWGSRNKKSQDFSKTIGMASAASIFLAPIAAPVIMVKAGATTGLDIVNAKKFEKGIMEIIGRYSLEDTSNKLLDDFDIEEDQNKQQSKEVVCECGNKIAEGMRFCPECGKKRDDGMRICKCGQSIKSEMKFCPYCGEKSEE